MTNSKRVIAGSLLTTALLVSPAAFAGLTGNVGGVSEYMFRGVSQSTGAALQGGIDYVHESGLYVGTWASNISFAGGTETDLYAGYAGKFGDVGFDVGALYYWYPEEDENASEYSTFEAYLGFSFGPVGLKYFYSDEANFFLGDGIADAAGYLLGTLSLPISDSLNFTANVGYYDGDEIERAFGETSYIDYSVGLAKSIEGGFTASFQFITSDLPDDDPKFVIGLKKSFEL